MTDQHIDRLVSEISRPIFLRRMHRAQINRPGERGKASAKIVAKAESEIRKAVLDYVRELVHSSLPVDDLREVLCAPETAPQSERGSTLTTY